MKRIGQLGVAMLLNAALAHAESNITPHALVSYEQDSNLLLVPENALQLDASGEPRLQDSFEDYSGGIDADYLWRDNRLYLTTNVSRFEYQHFTQLNHNEFAATTGLDWTATHKLKGNIGGQYDRHQLSFVDINTSSSSPQNLSYIETAQMAKTSATYDMNSHWHIDAGGSYSTAKLPDAGAQSYDMSQSEGNVGVKFTGSAKLTTGINIDRQNGHYNNSTRPGYTQTLYQYTIDYKLGARTSVNGGIGYNKRVQTGTDLPTNITGSFSFNQQLTAKTSYYIQFRRTQDTYNTAFGSQLTTAGIIGVNWQATQKISLAGNYEQDKAQVTGDISGTTNTRRDDKLKAANVSLKYTALRWLTISPYYRYQKRDSDLTAFNFRNNTYGISFEARFQP